MRKINLFAVLLLAAAPLAANAADGTITFTGKVNAKTCEINAGSSKDFTVNLPPVGTTALKTAGDVAGRTAFSINLTNCSAGKVATYFEPGVTVDSSTGNLVNTATGGASNVQLQLLTANGSVVKVSGTGTLQAGTWTDVADKGAAKLDYAAQYFATGQSTAGDVASSVKYTIIYN
ncbi:fimbrial protein [Stenotrophomonas sp. S41]|uniref:fimbrial protein n=1 Tax=Stenotrophomonas sp. S41 TaxID=2767464 RepID=UPI00190CC1BF|nr:fimbrial protein [Stenotrophomonas sp. S41]MBK0012739.1 type 1 fimbrial protein [Stenotrophomonas sp. S41]